MNKLLQWALLSILFLNDYRPSFFKHLGFWGFGVIEPATMNDARLFSLESRMHEEEEIRIKEYEFVRDLLKKLIYSLEKTNVPSIDGILGS